MTQLQFCGAAGTVTGSSTRVQTAKRNFLVDCGLFQGNRTTQALNLGDFPYDAGKLEFLLLTHAHIDHSGLLPKLNRAGFTGPIHTTEATADLLRFMLPDSAYIQESNAARQNKKNERRGLPEVEPIYTIEDAEATLQNLQVHPYDEWFEPKEGIRVRFWNAGHLLGSLSAEVEIHDDDETIRTLFSGDLGPQEKAFHPPPDAASGYDYVICESTYGNRDRVDYTLEARRAAMKEELGRALKKGGNVVIPSFAVERSQELLHDIAVLLDSGEIPDATVYLDSPLARRATAVFIKHAGAMEDIEVDEAELFRHPNFRLVQSVEESKRVNEIRKGAIIISASGMCTAGRIKHHLKANIYRPECTVLFVGYQSPGTLGHIITSGAKSVRIHGKEYQVRADIRRIGNYSAHADQPELIRWITQRGPIRGGLFLNHGEDDARAELKKLLVAEGLDGSKIYLPKFDQAFNLKGHDVAAQDVRQPRIDATQIVHDWHNEYAKFVLQLGETMRATPEARDREALLKRLRAELDA
ncbi:MAG: MBL fold metallo-hydrolase [Planctomycetota bacterium]